MQARVTGLSIQPVLLMALDDYFANPSQDCLARLFDAVNSMDISQAPVLSPYEKIIMRTSERKDLFIEKFEDLLRPKTTEPLLTTRQTHKTSDSTGSRSSFEDGLVIRPRDERSKAKEFEQKAASSTTSLQGANQYSPSENSFNLDGSAVWVESGSEQTLFHPPSGMASNASSGSHTASVRGRKSTDASSSSSSHNHGRREDAHTPLPNASTPVLKDTHFFPATIDYNDHALPIRLPMYTFPEEVGDVSPCIHIA